MVHTGDKKERMKENPLGHPYTITKDISDTGVDTLRRGIWKRTVRKITQCIRGIVVKLFRSCYGYSYDYSQTKSYDGVTSDII